MKIDLLSLEHHKIYGPKGVGALYVHRKDPRVRLTCQMDGGGHERGMRSGTLNVPGIVGLGAAAEICRAETAQEAARLTELRDRLHKGIVAQLDYVKLNGHPTDRLPGTLNLSFAYVEGEAMMMKMKDIAVSSGSACTSASLEPSHVLRAIGVGDDLAHSLDPFFAGAVQHDGGGGLRRRADCQGGERSSRAEPPVRAGAGGRQAGEVGEEVATKSEERRAKSEKKRQ